MNTLPNFIENSANLFPNKEAFRFGKSSLTYTDLNHKTNQLAKHLVDSGVQKGDRVGIYMNRCLETAIAIYGILKAGAAYVPINPVAPRSRVQFLIDDCGIQFLVTVPKQKKRINKLLEQETALKQVIGITDSLDGTSISWTSIFSIAMNGYQKVAILSDDLAYVMYTSGSTGTPKGIMHTHKSGMAYAQLSSELYGVKPEDRVANHAPIHFDISTFGYFSAPFASATTIIIPDAHTNLPASLGALIAEEKISIWYSVPLALSQLLLSGVLDTYDFSSIRWVLFGGESFTIKYLKRLMKKWPQANYSNVYGPAEVNQCTYYNFSSNIILEDYLPIGAVWNETEFKVIDENENQVEKDSAGELVICSTTMMKGYWNNAALTSKSLFTDKVEENIEKKYYRTGDIVRHDAKNNLVFLGRKDRQVKIRGYRIELDEVEAVLNGHHAVEESTVCVIENENNEKILTAAVILMFGLPTESKELISYCRSKLPTYAIPHRIEIFENFPRTGSGKIDLTQIKQVLI